MPTGKGCSACLPPPRILASTSPFPSSLATSLPPRDHPCSERPPETRCHTPQADEAAGCRRPRPLCRPLGSDGGRDRKPGASDGAACLPAEKGTSHTVGMIRDWQMLYSVISLEVRGEQRDEHLSQFEGNRRDLRGGTPHLPAAAAHEMEGLFLERQHCALLHKGPQLW